MRAAVLVIIHDGVHSIGVYDDESQALSALGDFVSAKWVGKFGPNGGAVPEHRDDRIRRFFLDKRGAYVIGDADLSSLAPDRDDAPPR